jgi:cytosine/adenosine deaminase-related metal-dependent hydrolase/phosphohistidine phosphatase SixA
MYNSNTKTGEMMRLFRHWVVALLAVTGAAAASAEPIAISHVDVLPMTATERLHDQNVIVDAGRIAAVGPARSTRIPTGARIIAGRGLTLMPGLVDMHVHLAPAPGAAGDPAQRAMAVMLGHGITTARGMAGSPNNLVVREAVESGRLAGPRFYAAAPAIHRNNTATPEAGRAAVAAAAQARYDLIKSHEIVDPAIWQAVEDEAHRLHMPVAGHVTNQVAIERAMAEGQEVEHLDGILYALLPENAPERQIDFSQIPPPQVALAAARATDARIEALARRLAAAHIWMVPTLGLFEKIVDPASTPDRLRADPDMRYIPEPALDQWSRQRAGFIAEAGYTPEASAAFTDLRRRIVRIFHRAGVPIMAGSDTAQEFHIWGPGLISEVQALNRAGLTPMQALRSATVVPRDYFRSLPNGGSGLGWHAEFGTVEPGARADLILLRGDPSRDLAALRRLDTVIAAGRVYDRPRWTPCSMLPRAPPSRPQCRRRGTDMKLKHLARTLLPLLAASAAIAPAAAQQGAIYVMRHLDTPAGERDPDLTPEGAAAAQRLVQLFAAERPRAIYVSDYRRTQQTAAALAARLGLTPITYDPADTPGLIARVRGGPLPALVIGHSNTVPEIIAALGGTRPAPLVHEDFGDVWRVAANGTTTKARIP